MRIIGGDWGGRPLTAPKGQRTRPTSDRVRESVFNILGAKVVGSTLLDLFAGTGAVALEALSRGARSAVCVEKDRAAIAALRANQTRLGAHQLELRTEAVDRYLETPGRFDLVYIDPPWAEVSAFLARHGAEAYGWVEPGGWLLLEQAHRSGAPAALRGFEAPDLRRYGDTLIALYERQFERV